MTTCARRCTEFIVISYPPCPPRSPLSADNKAIEHMVESRSAVEATVKTVYVIKQGAGSYG